MLYFAVTSEAFSTDISKFPDVPGAIIFPDLTAVNFANLLSFLNFLI